VPFAKKHGISILSDLAYARSIQRQSAAVGAAGQRRDGALRRVHFDVEDIIRCQAGAWALRSNERIISALTRVKSYLDYGAFTPVQWRRPRR